MRLPRAQTGRRASAAALFLCALALGGCATLGTGGFPTRDAADAVRRSVDHYGGEEALRKHASFHAEGVVLSLLQGRGNVVRDFRYPDRLRVVIAYGPRIETRLWDGKTGWRQGTVVTGPPLDAMVLQAARHALPLLLLDRRGEVVDRGTDTFEDREVRVLELPLGNTLVVTAEIDAKTGRILRSAGRGGSGGSRGGPLEFLTTYTEFRTVDGVLFPVRERNYANGFVTGETILGTVELRDVPDEAFRP